MSSASRAPARRRACRSSTTLDDTLNLSARLDRSIGLGISCTPVVGHKPGLMMRRVALHYWARYVQRNGSSCAHTAREEPISQM